MLENSTMKLPTINYAVAASLGVN